MADEDSEKAAKLAAAKKRFEQLKKEQKKGKKGAGKKKADKEKEAEGGPAEGDAEADGKADGEIDPAEDEAGDGAGTGEGGNGGAAVDGKAEGAAKVGDAASKSEKSIKDEALTAQAEVQELYKKRTARIEELEKANQILKEQHEQDSSRLRKAEEELESLREGSSEVAELRTKAKEADRLNGELASVQRQLAQAQKESKGSGRRQSAVSPGAAEQLATKDAAIQSLELDMSNLRNQIAVLESSLSEREATNTDLEKRAKTADEATEAAKQELDALRVSIAFPSDETKSANEDPEALTKRISVLESDLRTANNNLEAAAQRAQSLEQKIEALTKLHKEAVTASQAKDKELIDLRSQLQRRNRPSHVRDASEFELGEDETETGQLQARIRALEAENFDLRRGVWRDRRTELQPGMEDEHALEDVDLNGPSDKQRGSLPRQTSTFQDVLTSGINAFTGRERENHVRDRAPSMGLLSEDGFDEEAFRLAHEEEQKRRIERIKEVKRGLDQWRGWRVDLADIRGNGIGDGRPVGPVFEM